MSASKRTRLLWSLFARVPFHWPGMHSGWNVGRRLIRWSWVWGEIKMEVGGKDVILPRHCEGGLGIRSFQPNTCEPDIETLSHTWPGGPAWMGLLQLFLSTLHIRHYNAAGQSRATRKGESRDGLWSRKKDHKQLLWTWFSIILSINWKWLVRKQKRDCGTGSGDPFPHEGTGPHAGELISTRPGIGTSTVHGAPHGRMGPCHIDASRSEHRNKATSWT